MVHHGCAPTQIWKIAPLNLSPDCVRVRVHTVRTYVSIYAGTSSGFGRELVHAALNRGDCVVATARTLERIQDFPRTDKIRLLQLDVTDGFASIKAKVDSAVGFFGHVDVVVNNAGTGIPCLLEEGG